MINVDIVVAHDQSLGIGRDNTLAWHIPEDMRFFRRLTTITSLPTRQNAVIMGRRTYESLPDAYRPLPNRYTIVVSKTRQYEGDTLCTVASLDAAVERAESGVSTDTIEQVFCIGGGQLYQAFLNHVSCRHLFVTQIENSYDCDTYFPAYATHFSCIHESPKWVSQKGKVAFQFKTYQKNK